MDKSQNKYIQWKKTKFYKGAEKHFTDDIYPGIFMAMISLIITYVWDWLYMLKFINI
jgi:hypothetical protein